MNNVQFFAEHIAVEYGDGSRIHVTVIAPEKDIVEEISVEGRLHEVEPVDIVQVVGGAELLGAMTEMHFEHWVRDGGDYYEALNAIGIEKIQEWVNDYCSGE